MTISPNAHDNMTDAYYEISELPEQEPPDVDDDGWNEDDRAFSGNAWTERRDI